MMNLDTKKKRVILLFGGFTVDQLTDPEIKESFSILWEDGCEMIAVGPANEILPATENGSREEAPYTGARVIVCCARRMAELAPELNWVAPECCRPAYNSLRENREPTNRELEETELDADQQHTVLEPGPEPEKPPLVQEGGVYEISEVQECLMEVCDALSHFQQGLAEKFKNISIEYGRELTSLDAKHDGLGIDLSQIEAKVSELRRGNISNLAKERRWNRKTEKALKTLTNQISAEEKKREDMQCVLSKAAKDVQKLDSKLDELKAVIFQQDYGMSPILGTKVTTANIITIEQEPESKQQSDVTSEPEIYLAMIDAESEPGDWAYWGEAKEDEPHHAEEQVPGPPETGKTGQDPRPPKKGRADPDTSCKMRNKVKKLLENLSEHMNKKE